MGLIMLLAIRPRWLENYFNGLDKMYLLHKWSGIWAISFAGLHYLLELSKNLLIMIFERPVRVHTSGQMVTFLGQYKRLAENLGEWVLWFLLISLVLALWHRFSYHIWRYTHKFMSLAFLIIVFHVIVLSPSNYWTQPVGWIIVIICIVGVCCALLAILGFIGRGCTFNAVITRINLLSQDITEVVCHIDGKWQHIAGQYVFLLTNRLEGAHPFTIASADQGDNQIGFCIKALGDYTRKLPSVIKIGNKICIEGPYGRFDFRKSAIKKQIWIGGGIGITPFIAWLESLQNNPDKDAYYIDVYYCVSTIEQAVFIDRLQNLTAHLANVTLCVYCSQQQGYLTIDQLNLAQDAQGNYPSLWFCGPNTFAQVLKADLIKKQIPLDIFHQECFQMR